MSNRPLPMAVFPETDAFTTNEKTIYVTHRGGSPATGLSVAQPGLQSPFAFKGGAYPGIGGTCGSSITSDCTLVLTFAPRASPANNRFNQAIQFAYQSGPGITNSAEFRLIGRARPPGSIRLPGAAETSPVITLPTSLAGASTLRVIRTLSVSGVVKHLHWLESPRAPFRLLRDDIDASKTYTEPAFVRFELEFSPTSPGRAEQQIVLEYDNGLGPQILAMTLRAQAFYPTAANVLTVYNERSPESVAVKDYYLARRPGFSGANVMAIAPGDTSLEGASPPPADALNPESMERTAFATKVSQPILDWLATHQDKTIGYIVLLHGVPTRLHWKEGGLRKGVGIAQALRQALSTAGYRGLTNAAGDATPIVTHLSMGSLAATRAYIDKLKRMHDLMARPEVILSARNARKSGATYFIEDTTGYGSSPVGWEIGRALAIANPAALVDYRTNTGKYIVVATDVAGYFTWGSNGRRGGDYAVDGSTRFAGNSDWYIIQTNESFNGQRGTDQGNYVDWFSAKAFGGDNFSHTPIGAVAHVEEPLAVANDASLFALWEKGQLFGDCAWASAGAGKVFLLVLGDPLVRR